MKNLSAFKNREVSKLIAVIVIAAFFPTFGYAQSSGTLTLLTGKAIYLFNQNKLDESLIHINKILELDPQNKIAKDYYNKILQSKTSNSSVAETTNDPISKRPAVYDPEGTFSAFDADEMILKGLVAFHNKDYEKSIKAFRDVLARDPANETARTYLALVLFKQEDFDRSLAEWKELRKINPENESARSYEKKLLDSTYDQLGKMTGSITLPKTVKKISTTKDEPLKFEGIESKTLFDVYSTDGLLNDEDTIHVGEKLKIRTSLYDNPLDFTGANDFWRSHGDTRLSIGSWESGDYELINRLRQLTMKYYSKEMQVMVGDISTNYLYSKNPNRFILPGVDFRGVDFVLDKETFRTKFLWGFVPRFEDRLPVSGATRDSAFTRIVNSNESLRFSRNYFYPRELTAFDILLRLHPKYELGLFFSHTEDHSAVKKISQNFPFQDNYITGFSQSINFFPGKNVAESRKQMPEFEKGKNWNNFLAYTDYLKDNFKWYVFHEFNYGWLFQKIDNTQHIYTREDVLPRNLNFNDFATYLRSEMALPKWHNETIYQRIQPNFRNLGGFTYFQTVTYDREIIDSKSYFFPKDNLNFSFNASKTRANLNHNPLVGRENWQSGKMDMRWLPGGKMPDVLMDVSLENYKSSDGGEFVSNDWILGSYCLGLSKKVYDWDLNGQYKVTVSNDDRNDFNQAYINHFSFEAFKTFCEKIDFTLGHFFTDKNVCRPVAAWDYERDYNNHTDATLTFALWDTASLSLLYSYMLNNDNFQEVQDVTEDAKIHTLSATFGWPVYLKNVFSHQLDLYPYIALIANDSNRTDFSNVIIEPTFKMTYKISPDTYFNLVSSFRNDSGYGQEYRFYSYLKIAIENQRAKVKDVQSLKYLKSYSQYPRKYTIGYNDTLLVEILEKDSFKILNEGLYTVDQAGHIKIDSFADIYVYGLTADEAKQLISDDIKSKFSNYEVHVTPKGDMNDKIIVIGEVANPGVYPLRGNLTAYEAIALAGGTSTDRADLSNIKIIRPATGEKINADLTDYILENDVKNNISLQSGDVVFVPKNIKAKSGDFASRLFGKRIPDKTKIPQVTELSKK